MDIFKSYTETKEALKVTKSDLSTDLVELDGHKIGDVYQKQGLGDELELVYITKYGTFDLVSTLGKGHVARSDDLDGYVKTDERRMDWLTWRLGESKQYSHGPLSNFYVEKDGKTLEHRFQALKTNDMEQKRRIMECSTPGQAKKVGKNKQLTSVRPDWDEIKRDLMWDLLLKKFMANPFARKYLLATDDAVIREKNTWNDRVWGVNLQNQGHNLLGMGLMYVREVLNDS